MFSSGRLVAEIMAAVGVSRGSVGRIVQKAGLPCRPKFGGGHRPPEKPHRLEIQRGYEAGEGIKALARRFNRTPPNIRYWIRKLGWQRPDGFTPPKGHFLAPEKAAERVALLQRGMTCKEIGRRTDVSESAVYAFKRRRIAQGVTFPPVRCANPAPRPVREPLAMPLRDSLFAALHARVPRGLPHHIADDVRQEMYLAIIEGREDVSTIRARPFVSAAYSQLAASWSASLDAPIGDGSLTWLDRLADPESLDPFEERYDAMQDEERR